jgi:Protein of unknwon function (DUF3008)
MPAVSKAQQQLMGMAYALKKGDMDPKDASQEVRDLADSMTLKQLRDYAETKHEGLPNKKIKESGLTGFLSAGPFPRINSYPQNVATSWIGILRDKKDPLVQSFLEFIDGKSKGEKTDEAIAAMAPPGVAAPQGTPGMGNVTPPSAGNVGSGDRFDSGSEDDDDIKNRVGIMSYEDYKKWIKKWQKQKAQM